MWVGVCSGCYALKLLSSFKYKKTLVKVNLYAALARFLFI